MFKIAISWIFFEEIPAGYDGRYVMVKLSLLVVNWTGWEYDMLQPRMNIFYR